MVFPVVSTQNTQGLPSKVTKRAGRIDIRSAAKGREKAARSSSPAPDRREKAFCAFLRLADMADDGQLLHLTVGDVADAGDRENDLREPGDGVQAGDCLLYTSDAADE